MKDKAISDGDDDDGEYADEEDEEKERRRRFFASPMVNTSSMIRANESPRVLAAAQVNLCAVLSVNVNP